MLPLPGAVLSWREKMKENNGVLCPTFLIDSFSVVHLNGVSQSRMTSCLNGRAMLHMYVCNIENYDLMENSAMLRLQHQACLFSSRRTVLLLIFLGRLIKGHLS